MFDIRGDEKKDDLPMMLERLLLDMGLESMQN